MPLKLHAFVLEEDVQLELTGNQQGFGVFRMKPPCMIQEALGASKTVPKAWTPFNAAEVIVANVAMQSLLPARAQPAAAMQFTY